MSEVQQQDKFDFELVSPEDKLLSEPAQMVVIPGEEGDFGVLVNHAATVSSIRPGVIQVFKDNEQEPRLIFVAGGFADVTPTSCVVLAEEAIQLKDLNQEALEKNLTELNEDLLLTEGELHKARIQSHIRVVKAKLSALTGKTVL